VKLPGLGIEPGSS